MADDLDLAPIHTNPSPELSEGDGSDGIPPRVLVGGIALVALLAVLVLTETSSGDAAGKGGQDEEGATDDGDDAESDTWEPWNYNSSGGLIQD